MWVGGWVGGVEWMDGWMDGWMGERGGREFTFDWAFYREWWVVFETSVSRSHGRGGGMVCVGMGRRDWGRKGVVGQIRELRS